MYRQPLGNYRNIVSIRKYDVCKLIDEELENPSSLYGKFLKSFNDLADNVIHKCPYNEQFRVSNYSVPSNYLFAYPKGDFLLAVKLYDDFDKNAMDDKLFFTVSSNKLTIL